MENLLQLLHTTIRMATPIALAALGGLYGHLAGVLNVSLEGLMLSSAFTSVIVSYFTGNAVLAVISGILSSLLLSLLFAFFGISLKGNLTIIGLAINTLVSGGTAYILQVVFGQRGTFSDNAIVGIKPLDIPVLRNIPVLGKLFNNHTPIVYISFIALIVLTFILYKTRLGVYIRAVGENEEAVSSVGLSSNKIKYISLMFGGVLCGLAGANISLENVSMFVEDMTGGRGFIAMAAIYCGKGSPVETFMYSFLFGLADALQIRLQNINVPGAFVQMIPYLTIVLVLTITALMSRKKQRR